MAARHPIRRRLHWLSLVSAFTAVTLYARNREAAAQAPPARSPSAPPRSIPLEDADLAVGWAVRRECAYPLSVIFIIYSNARHWRRRAALRDSLFGEDGKRFFNWTALFLVDRTPDDPPAEAAWAHIEADALGDAVLLRRSKQASGSSKLLLAMRWVRQHCTRTLYVIKMDDDTLVEPFALMQHLVENVEPTGRLLHCTLRPRTSRRPGWAWSHELVVSNRSLAKLPRRRQHCLGRVIIMNVPIVRDLLRASSLLPTSRWSEGEDFVTGDLALVAGLGHVDLSSRVSWRRSEAHSFLDGWLVFFRFRDTSDLSTLIRAVWDLAVWNEALNDENVRKALTHRSEAAPYDPEVEKPSQ
ncbi:hypothetical protein HPB48_019963 [Haemaphysalis longicornis]|uniref:Hexosyltransferase n=1 Tax=Haemaphysalis longicornis TaxID=44386 RepID=A0A9J6GA98_HAELO|nr:hypothetical protein HPB48_019963 [Haemaphysalis longicornis]